MKNFRGEGCPIARTIDIAGDRWTGVLMREAFAGVRRFDDFQERLRVNRATLTKRLNRLVKEGMLERKPYQERPVRHEYRLTAKGTAFFDVLAAMWRWGDDWLFGAGGAPVNLLDRESEAVVRPVVVDEGTGKRLEVRKLKVGARERGRV